MEKRYCPWCFRETEASICTDPGCNRAIPRTAEDVSPLATHPFSRHIVDWRYRVTKFIADGGYGSVYRAYDRFKDQMVAIKFLVPTPRSEVEDRIRRKFELEASVLGRLSHEHIVALFDVEGIHEGPPCLIMELLRGMDLDAHLRKRGRLSPPDALGWITPVCDALQFAHDRGCLHLDIKPSNIFRHQEPGGTPVIKVLDFGIARITHGEPRWAQGNASLVYGTPQYVAPEVAKGGEPTPESDLYSLGTILYEVLSGHTPFHEGTPEEILNDQVSSSVPPLSPDLKIPEDLMTLVFALLQKKPEERPRTANEVGRRLKEIRHRLSHVPDLAPSRPGDGTDIQDGTPGSDPDPHLARTSPERPPSVDSGRRRSAVFLLGMLLLGVLLGLGISWVAGHLAAGS